MKKNLRIFLAVAALSGIINCFVVEPAIAVQEETVCLSDDGHDCCFVCCSFNHQILQSSSASFSPSMGLSGFVSSSSPVRPDVPVKTIFHPPLFR
ncbi:MAG: hypothetical protein A2Z83_01575 [Omnitrophica bacterium GWA2_52_8]|nr:MAG: hypothetical protein A2Z83_01575 [Omnitrophica bacterium GWA2_52_8]